MDPDPRPPQVTFAVTKDLPRAEVLALYRAAGWFAQDDPAPQLDAMIANSFAVSAAFDPAGRLLGMARALSDGVSDAYILDVVVRPDHRRQSIGRCLVSALAEHLASFGIDWIVCIGVPGTESLYKSAGGEPMTGHTPFRFALKPGEVAP
ncbi:MAG: GNAT family N-acetyltransferase [Lentisphaeria bacterium]|nr:GNAT family N-acetyltransferase [Lentisphaeria bacterium]